MFIKRCKECKLILLKGFAHEKLDLDPTNKKPDFDPTQKKGFESDRQKSGFGYDCQ